MGWDRRGGKAKTTGPVLLAEASSNGRRGEGIGSARVRAGSEALRMV